MEDRFYDEGIESYLFGTENEEEDDFVNHVSKNYADDGGYRFQVDEYTTELYTPTFVGWDKVPLDMMHIVCKPMEIPRGVCMEISDLGLNHEEFQRATWSDVKAGFGWCFTILFRKDDIECKNPLELLMSPNGKIYPFFDHKDLKVFYIREVLQKKVTL